MKKQTNLKIINIHEHLKHRKDPWGTHVPCKQMREKHNKHNLKTPNKPLILAFYTIDKLH